MTKRLKGVLFDFNGTMFFDGPKHEEAWNNFSWIHRNKAITKDELTLMHGQTNKKIIHMLMGETMDEQESKQLSIAKEALYRECCLSDISNFHLVNGLEELLNELKREQIPMTICSASIKDNIDFFVESFKLERWFDPHHIVYDDGSHQDKITMFQKGAAFLQIPISECLVFEDSFSGIQFANQAGVGKIIAITSPDDKVTYERLECVDSIIYDYLNFHSVYIK